MVGSRGGASSIYNSALMDIAGKGARIFCSAIVSSIAFSGIAFRGRLIGAARRCSPIRTGMRGRRTSVGGAGCVHKGWSI